MKLIIDVRTRKVEHVPDAEKEEIMQIFREKGLAIHLADKLAEIISSDKQL